MAGPGWNYGPLSRKVQHRVSGVGERSPKSPMSASASAFLRLVGPATAAATLALASLPAFAQTATSSSPANCSQVRFELANPSPGAMLEPGGLVLEGIALDSRAPQSQAPGIDRIDFFLGNRD